MVSFQCDNCADTVKKPALDKHRNRCWGTFTCLDCSKTFQGTDYKSHTSCISEAEKYEKTLYKGGKNAKQPGHAGNNAARFQPYPKGRPQNNRNAPPAPPSNPESPAQDPSQAGAAPAVHPSRAGLVAGDVPSANGNGKKPAFPALHPGSRYPPPREQMRWQNGRKVKASGGATGMNNIVAMGDVPMRSWGTSPAVTDNEDANNEGGSSMTTEKKKKNKKKGDKGGCGSRANSNPSNKERSGDHVAATVESPVVPNLQSQPSEPTSSDLPKAEAKQDQVKEQEGEKKKKRKEVKEASQSVAEPIPAAVVEATSSDSKKAKKARKHSDVEADATTPEKSKKSKKSKDKSESEQGKKDNKEKKAKKDRGDETPEEKAARKAAKKAKKEASA